MKSVTNLNFSLRKLWAPSFLAPLHVGDFCSTPEREIYQHVICLFSTNELRSGVSTMASYEQTRKNVCYYNKIDNWWYKWFVKTFLSLSPHTYIYMYIHNEDHKVNNGMNLKSTICIRTATVEADLSRHDSVLWEATPMHSCFSSFNNQQSTLHSLTTIQIIQIILKILKVPKSRQTNTWLYQVRTIFFFCLPLLFLLVVSCLLPYQHPQHVNGTFSMLY